MREWVSGIVRIATEEKVNSVRGYTNPDYPGLSITQTQIERSGKTVFVITHADTGLAISLPFYRLEKAQKGIEFLCKTGLNWNIPVEDISPVHRERYKTVIESQGGRLVRRDDNE